jgi:hypothetical protein
MLTGEAWYARHQQQANKVSGWFNILQTDLSDFKQCPAKFVIPVDNHPAARVVFAIIVVVAVDQVLHQPHLACITNVDNLQSPAFNMSHF